MGVLYLFLDEEDVFDMAEVSQEPSQEPSQVVLPAWRPWIPSIDDCWDAYERIKANFSRGIIRGANQTIIDTVAFVSTWRIWKTPYVLRCLIFIISMGLICLRRLNNIFTRVYSNLPSWVRHRLDVLKIPIRLQKAQDVLEDTLEKLENELGNRAPRALT